MEFTKNHNSLSTSSFNEEIKIESSKIEDNLLWKSFKEGNKKAFRHIYNKNFDILFQYGLRITPNQNLIEDQLQDFFVYLWNKKENLTINYSITNYLIFSFRNNLIRALKKENKNKKLPEWELESIEEKQMIDNDDLSRIKTMVDILPVKQREIIHLKYFQSLNGSEIAEIMGVSKGGAYNLLSRAISNLKQKMHNDRVNT